MDDWQTSFALIRDINTRIDNAIDTAIRYEEQQDPMTAIVNYKLSVMLIDEALATPVGLPEDSDGPLDDSWNQTCQLIQTLKIKRGELVQRVSQLLAKIPAAPAVEAINTDDTLEEAIDCSATEDSMSRRPWTHSELAAELRRGSSQSDENKQSTKMQLIYVCDNVEFFHIKSTGEVTKSEEKSELRILCIDGKDEKHLQATFFMQIIPQSVSGISLDVDSPVVEFPEEGATGGIPTSGSLDSFDNPWIYPLVPDVSPCYYTRYGAFVFPDLHSKDNSMENSIGVVVSKEYEEYLLDVLQAILNTVIHEAEPHRSKRSTSEAVSENIVRGASYISNGLIFSSTKVGEFLEKSTPYVMSKMNRAPSNYETPVSSGVVTGIEVAKTATGMAASVTGYVAEKVTSATVALGQYLAPHVQKQGTRLLTHTMGYSQDEANDKMTGAFVIAAGAVEGIGTVYSGLEQSASLLGSSLSTNSVRVIKHKYGPGAGELASGTFDTVGNVINISHNVGMLHPKSLAKRTAKNAAMFQRQMPFSSNRPTIPASAMHPDLGEVSRAAIANIK